MIKLRKERVGHIVHMGELKSVYRIRWEEITWETRYVIYERIILTWKLKE
jgi:hypothetical protein